MSVTPRHYQHDHLNRYRAARANGVKRMLITSATGTGKTNLISWIAGELIAEGCNAILVLGHTDEIIGQCYQRIGGICQLDEMEIDIEQGNQYANRQAKVIVSSIQTLLSGKRLAEWQPDAIIVDESHHYESPEWKKALARLGAFDGKTLLIGFTATSARGDKKSIYAYDLDGNPTLKTKDADKLQHCLFERLVSEYSIVDAVEQAWLTPITAFAVRTDTDINDVKKTAGEYNRKDLQNKVDAPARTKLAIDTWEKLGKDRPTIVFCAGVEHAHHAAEMWRERGYTAQAVDGSTDKVTRRELINAFQYRELQVLCNMGIATEGFDAPPCSCIVHLRPTTSETLYTQMSGRGLRPLPGTVDIYPEAHHINDRKRVIAESVKYDCLMIDVVDITKDKSLRTAAGLIGLPPDIDLQGHDLMEVKDLLAKYEQRKERIIGERPQTFAELEGVLVRVDVLATSGAKTAGEWRINTEGAYIYDHLPPNRKVTVQPLPDGTHRMEIFENGQRVARKRAPSEVSLQDVFDDAKFEIDQLWPKPSEANRYTWSRFTEKQQAIFANKLGLSKAQVDPMPYAKAKAILDKYFQDAKTWDRFSPKQQAVFAKMNLTVEYVNALGYEDAREKLDGYFSRR